MKLFLVLLILTQLSCSVFASNENNHLLRGAGSSGGGFQFMNEKALLKRIARKTSRMLSSLTEAQQLNLKYKYKRNFDLDKLRKIIENVKSAPMENVPRVNSDGYNEPIIFDFDPKSSHIIALKPYFDLRQSQKITTEYQIARLLIHEASHLFGIGLNNDSESYSFSKEIMDSFRDIDFSLFGRDLEQCGSYGTEKERIDNCGLTYYFEYNFRDTLQNGNKYDVVLVRHSNALDAGVLVLDTKVDLGFQTAFYINKFVSCKNLNKDRATNYRKWRSATDSESNKLFSKFYRGSDTRSAILRIEDEEAKKFNQLTNFKAIDWIGRDLIKICVSN